MSGMSKSKTSKRETIIGISSLVILFDLGFWVLYLLIFTDYGEKYTDLLAAAAIVLLNFMVLPFFVLFADIKIKWKRKQKKKKTLQNPIELTPTEKEKKKRAEYQLMLNNRDKLKNEKCLICKLPIRLFELITRCPKCFSYFHKEHLDNWLMKRKKCPVCGMEMNEKYE